MLKMKTTSLLLVSVAIILTGCKSSGNESTFQFEESVSELIEKDFTASRSMVVKNGIAYHIYSKEIDPSSGNGSGLYIYTRDLETGESSLHEFEHLSHLRIGMFSVTKHPEADRLYIQYVDRSDERDRTVYVDEFNTQTGEVTNVLEYQDIESAGVLNPISAVGLSANRLHVLVPDRAAEPKIRWFTVDLETNEVGRQNDLQFDTPGIRTYGYKVKDEKLYLPVNTVGNLYLVTLDLEKLELITSSVIDELDHSEPTRMTDIDFYGDNLLVIKYMRPADFSHRPTTGLVGSYVANMVDVSEGKSLHIETLAGFDGSEAVTHYVASDKFDDNHFVSIYTTVREVHTWHLSRVHDNYNPTSIDLYRVGDNRIELIDRVTTDPAWANRVTVYENQVLATYTSANEDHDAWLRIFNLDR
jgi:hypothetical protein